MKRKSLKTESKEAISWRTFSADFFLWSSPSVRVIAVNPYSPLCRMGQILPLCPQKIRWAVLACGYNWAYLHISDLCQPYAERSRERRPCNAPEKVALWVLMFISMFPHWWINIWRSSASNATSVESLALKSAVAWEEEVHRIASRTNTL